MLYLISNPKGLRAQLRFPISEKVVTNPVGIGRRLLLHSTEPRSSFTSQVTTFCVASQQNALVRFGIIVGEVSGSNPGLLPFNLKDSPRVKRLRHFPKKALDFGLTHVLNLRLYATRSILTWALVRYKFIPQRLRLNCRFFCLHARGNQ